MTISNAIRSQDHRAGLSGSGGVEAPGCQPALALRVEEEVLKAFRFWRCGSGGRDPALEERTGSRHRGARHPKKSHRVFRQGCKVRYAFVAKHRQQFTVRAMCRCLRIQASDLYASLKPPLSKRAREDARQTELISKAWKDSGRSTATASCMTTFWIKERPVVRTALPALQGLPRSEPRSATSVGPAPMVANRRSWSTIPWPGSSMSMRRTGHG